MSRPQNILRPVKLTTTLPEDVHSKLTLYLYSEVEGMVPRGAYQSFICDRIREFFEHKRLDIGSGIVHGPASCIDQIESILGDLE